MQPRKFQKNVLFNKPINKIRIINFLNTYIKVLFSALKPNLSISDFWIPICLQPGGSSSVSFKYQKFTQPELKSLEWDILNPDRLINLEINNKRTTSNI